MTDFDSPEPGEDLSEATVRLLAHLVSHAAPSEPVAALTPERTVAYVCAALQPAEAGEVEAAAAGSEENRELLVESARAVARYRRLPLSQVRSVAEAGAPEGAIAAAYLAIVSVSSNNIREEGLAEALSRGVDSARAAFTRLAAALESALAMPRMTAAFRTSASGVIVEGDDTVVATRSEEDERLRLAFRSPSPIAGEAYIAVDSGSGRIRLGHAAVEDGSAQFDLPADAVANGSLVVRFGDWPQDSVSDVVVFQADNAAVPPYIVFLTPPVVTDGQLVLDFDWIESGLISPGVLTVSFAYAPDAWQTLGSVDVDGFDTGMEVRMEYPGEPGPFHSPLRIEWNRFL